DPASRRARETIVVASRASDGAELARVRILPGGARPIVLDVTAALATAEAPLGVAIRATEPIELATPRHVDPRARPRLELTLSR
ncbi:MAG: hypothetical protein M3Y87_34770, partial [Myxococcota bacterium]|nr:hypothetical protein [Myxococcota bacterium]